MEKKEVSATLPAKKDPKTGQFLPGREKEKTATVFVQFGKDAAESVKTFGDEAVNSNAFANWRITLQAGIRRMLEKGKSQAEIASAMAAAKMGVATSTGIGDPLDSAAAKFLTMNKEEQAAYIKKLQASAAKG